jgi:hypothetical protein
MWLSVSEPRDHIVAFASVQNGISSLIDAEAERGKTYGGGVIATCQSRRACVWVWSTDGVPEDCAQVPPLRRSSAFSSGV